MDLNVLAEKLKNKIVNNSLVLDNSVIDQDSFAFVLGFMPDKKVEFSKISKDNITVKDEKNLLINGTSDIFGSSVNVNVSLSKINGECLQSILTSEIQNLNFNDMIEKGLIPTNFFNPGPFLPKNPFNEIKFQISSENYAMELRAEKSDNDIVLIESIGLKITDIGFDIFRQPSDEPGEYDTQLSIFGTFKIGSSDLTVSVSIPVSRFSPKGQWNLSLSSSLSLKDGVADISQLFFGTNVFEHLPPGVAEAAEFTIKSLQINFELSKSFIKYLKVDIGRTQPWEITDSFTIQDAGFNMSVTESSGKSLIDTNIYGKFKFGDKNDFLDVNMNIPPGNSDWQISMSGEFDDLDFSVLFGGLPGNKGQALPDLPIGLEFKSITINDLDISFNPSSKTLSNIYLNIATEFEFSIADGFLKIKNPSLDLNIDNPLNQNRELTGTIGGFLYIEDFALQLSATKPAADKGWIFTGSMLPGEKIEILELLTFFFKHDGKWELPDWVENDQNKLDIENVSISVITPDKQSTDQKTKYTVEGTVFWKLQFHSLSFSELATVFIEYDGQNFSGKITLNGQIIGMNFIIGYEFGKSKETVFLNWEGIQGTYTHDDTAKTDTILVTFGDKSLGEILSDLIHTFDPGFKLSSPWNVLNDINFSGLDMQFTRYEQNPSENKIQISWPSKAHPHKINLVFLEIDQLVLTKDKSGVFLGIEGKFLGQDIKQDDPLGGKGSNVQDLPGVPGAGEKFFYLQFLGMGQHLAFSDSSEIKNVTDAINKMEDAFGDRNKYPDRLPVPASSGSFPIVFNENSNWLIGTKFTLRNAIDVSIVFNDPELYGLLISVNKNLQQFSGLVFEIMYKKITDTVGVYQLELKLPDAYRQLEFGEVSITLPVIGIAIYTNGDFKLDFGFPASITDFSRCFVVQVFPFTGSGGFYFAMLSSVTADNLQKPVNGIFNPVLEFGLGLNIGLGKTINKGILNAGFYLVAVGIFEGTIATFHPYPGYEGEGENYYLIKGTFALVGRIYGEVNFAIISARVDIVAYISISIQIEAYKPIPIYFQAGVSVSLKVTVNLGIFKIHIHLSFSTTISESFVIGKDKSDQAPWKFKDQVVLKSLPLEEEIQRIIKWQPVIVDNKKTITLYFMPHPTLSQENGSTGTTAQYTASFYMKSPADENDSADTCMSTFCTGVLQWAVNALINSDKEKVTLEDLLKCNVTLEELKMLLCYLSTRDNNISPINYINEKHGFDIISFLNNYFDIEISNPDTLDEDLNAGMFPVIPDLIMEAFYNSTEPYFKVEFKNQNMTGKDYQNDIQDIFRKMALDYQSEIEKEYFKPEYSDKIVDPYYDDNPNLAFPVFLFQDFIVLTAKSMIQDSVDYLEGKSEKSITIEELCSAVNNQENIAGIAGAASRYMLHGMRLPEPPDADSGTVKPLYMISGQQIPIPESLKKGDNFNISLYSGKENILKHSFKENTSLNIVISDTEIQRINDLKTCDLAKVTSADSLPKSRMDNQKFTLKSGTEWDYPGDYFSDENKADENKADETKADEIKADEQDETNPYIFNFSQNMLQCISGHSSGDLSFTIKSLTQKQDGSPIISEIKKYRWSTIIKADIQKFKSDKNGDSIHNNIYDVIGADEAGIIYLENLLSYINTKGEDIIDQIQFLYSPDKTKNENGYQSEENGKLITALVQTNLSTETNPPDISVFAAAPEIQKNVLNDYKDFIRLLWQCSLVRSGGYYLYYSTKTDNKGLQDYLFNENNTGRIDIVITYKNFVSEKFINSVIIGDKIDYSKTTVYSEADNVQIKTANLPPGNVGIIIERNKPDPYVPPDKKDTPPSHTQNCNYLERQFNLIGYKLIDTDYRNLLPAGPSKDHTGDEIQNLPKVPKETDIDQWEYKAVIPYSKYMADKKLIESGNDFQYPKNDPYAGIGNEAEIGLNWQDMFGNILSQPVYNSDVKINVLYTDLIVSLSKWPSLSSVYFFNSNNNQPQININFVFDTSRYQSKDDAENNAKIDLELYKKVYFQLSHSNDISIYYRSSIDGDKKNPEGSLRAVNTELFLDYVKVIYQYLYYVMKNGTQPGTEDIQIPEVLDEYYSKYFPGKVDYLRVFQSFIIFDEVDIAKIADYTDILPLSLIFTIKRTRNVDPEFTEKQGVFGVESADTDINPLTEDLNKTNGNNGKDDKNSLIYFAQLFEQTFKDKPAEGIYLKVVTGISGQENAAGNKKKLWIVRFDESGKSGISINIDTGESYYFAPVPLSKTLISKDSVGINVYETGSEYPVPGKTKKKSFSEIDLDQWGRDFLLAVDDFLSPDYAVQAFIIDKIFKSEFPDEDLLQDILNAKSDLADALSDSLDFIIEPVDPDKSQILNAKDKFKQRLLIKLSNAYNINAVVQNYVSIHSRFKGSNTAPDVVPRFFGKMKADNVSLLSLKSNGSNNVSENYSLSTSKIPLGNGESWLTYILSVKEEAKQKSFLFNDMSYVINHVERDIHEIPGIKDYKASSWLTFVNNDDILGKKMGGIEIPVVLRAYPTPPSVFTQKAVNEESEKKDMESIINKAKLWDYQYVYKQAVAAQDMVNTEIHFNIPEDNKLLYNAANGPDIFSTLAQFNSVYNDIKADFNKYLKTININTKPDDTAAKNSYYAIKAFKKIVVDIADIWSEWSNWIHNKKLSSVSDVPYKYSISENKEKSSGDLIITIVSDPKNPSSQNLLIDIEGFTRQPTDTNNNKFKYLKKSETKYKYKYLKYDDRNNYSNRIASADGLDITGFYNAWSGVLIMRNQQLIKDKEGKWRNTNPNFIYQTPVVKFYNLLIPLLDCKKPINVAKYKTEKIQVLNLAEHLYNLFFVLTNSISEGSLILKVESRYSYSLNKGTAEVFDIILPLLLTTLFEFNVPSDLNIGSSPDYCSKEIGSFVCKLTGALLTWFGNNNPNRENGKFLFTIYVYSGKDKMLPSLKLENIYLSIDTIKDLTNNPG